jgi:hypothetical protein
MKHYKLLSLLALIISLAACKKSTYTPPPPPWNINFTDNTTTYNFTGSSYRMVSNSKETYFDASSFLGYSNTGQPIVFSASSHFSTYNGNAKKIGFGITLTSTEQTLISSMAPANNFDAKFAALQQWLSTKTFAITTPLVQYFVIKYEDEDGKIWIIDFNLPNAVTITDVVPYEQAGYTKCLKANIKFNFTMMYDINVAARKNISGTMTGFFTLDK